MNKKVKIIIGVIIGILVMGVVAFGVSKYFEEKQYKENIKINTINKVDNSKIEKSIEDDNLHRNIVSKRSYFYKPIIYIYPEQEEEIIIKLTNPDKITCSYPKYKNEWRVLAKPNGDLLDLDTNRNLYALYYENSNTYKYEVEKEGFVVKGEDTIKFLEEKLEILGLNEREAEEFIVYWLPKLEANKYNYIRFASKEEIERNMGLEISKEPETLIRILMTYKGLEKPIEVEEQKLEKVERKGYTVVEWGGSEIK